MVSRNNNKEREARVKLTKIRGFDQDGKEVTEIIRIPYRNFLEKLWLLIKFKLFRKGFKVITKITLVDES